MNGRHPDLEAVVYCGYLEIKLQERQLLRQGQLTRLTRIEWALLDLLVRNRGHVLTHRFLLRSVWGDSYEDANEYLHTYINRLRRKLEDDPQHPRYLLTEPGLGYRLVMLAALSGDEQAEDEELPQRLDAVPVPLISLVGREQAIRDVLQLLVQPDCRLLTLTGPGGVGKTQLALQIASKLRSTTTENLAFVSLGTIRNPGLVIATIAQALAIQDTGSVPLIERLKQILGERRLLLVLDNFEQLLDAAPLIGELLASAPLLKVLVTSRARLHLAGERNFPIAPLPFPPPTAQLSREQLANYPAIMLFMRRSQAIDPTFALTEENMVSVAEICRRLDGLPLAIELAAAWSNLLPPSMLLERLHHRLELLSSGVRDAPDRQQTLRATLDWSYELLSADEQDSFAALGVFAGGFSVEAAEQICAEGHGPEVLMHLAALLDKSLLRRENRPDGPPRLGMLETIREYAIERFNLHRRAEQIRERHAAYYLALAEQADGKLYGAEQSAALIQLRQEIENLRVALQWALQHAQAEIGIKLGIALTRFWHHEGLLQEARSWLNQLLDIRHTAALPLQGKLLNCCAIFAAEQVDYQTAIDLLHQSSDIAKSIGDKRGIAVALNNMGYFTSRQGDYAKAYAMIAESLPLYQELGDQWSISTALNRLGFICVYQECHEEAFQYFQESLSLKRAIGDVKGIGLVLHNIAWLKFYQGDLEEVARCNEESYAQFLSIDDRLGIGFVEHTQALLLLQQERYQESADIFRQSLIFQRERGAKEPIAWCIEGIALLAVKQGQLVYAGRLFGAAAAIRQSVGSCLSPMEQRFYAEFEAAARDQIGEAAWHAARAAGQQLSIDDAIRSALQPS